MNEKPNLEQFCYSRSAKSISKTGHDSVRILKRWAFYDRYYEIVKYLDLMASVSICLIEIS